MSQESRLSGQEAAGFSTRQMNFLLYAPSADGERRPDHEAIMGQMQTYLDLVPVGVRNESTPPITPSLRNRLVEERGHTCEACTKDITDQPFDVHHTDYGKENDPEWLKVLCQPCHRVVGVLTGVKWWFAHERGIVEKPQARKGNGTSDLQGLLPWEDEGFDFTQ